MMNDTIAAIATGLTESGIGIIRISGTDSFKIAEKIFKSKSGKNIELSQSHKVFYGFIYEVCEESGKGDAFSETDKKNENNETDECDNVSRETLSTETLSERAPQTEISLTEKSSTERFSIEKLLTGKSSPGEVIDEVLLLTMKAPRSYTGEDTIEIDCHGGILMMKKIFETVIRAGARPAEPGEFTKRAFLNGRIDLSQAEAVIDIINAKNGRALKASVSQLKGSVSGKIKSYREKLLEDTAYIEAALDDPEHISLEGFKEKLGKDIEEIKSGIRKLLISSENGKLIKEGINTVILGKPNAGKSSLLNVLLGEEKAIVTDIAGTTRDTLEASFNLSGITLNIIDTAGIRETEDKVEKIGIERALNAALNADFIIYVVDSSVEADKSDMDIIDFINTHDKKTLVLLNKSDLKQKTDEEELKKLLLNETKMLSVSAKNEIGIGELEKAIEEMFYSGDINYNDEVFLTSERQKTALTNALNAVKQVENSLQMQMSEDFYTIDLMAAYAELGYIIGEEVKEDLVNEIFSKFCMGK